MNLAKWIGARAADVVAFFRDKPFIPCQIDWDYRGSYVDPLNNLPDEFYEKLEDSCRTCETECCIVTDMPAEWREWNNRRD